MWTDQNADKVFPLHSLKFRCCARNDILKASGVADSITLPLYPPAYFYYRNDTHISIHLQQILLRQLIAYTLKIIFVSPE